MFMYITCAKRLIDNSAAANLLLELSVNFLIRHSSRHSVHASIYGSISWGHIKNHTAVIIIEICLFSTKMMN